MTKKIGVSLRQELYDWAAREVEERRAESVSALIAGGLELLEARAQLEAIVTELHQDTGELDDQARARLAEALAAADEAYRRHRSSRACRAGPRPARGPGVPVRCS
jgi:Arc/MetJ-type ribon-helix-helix transcriptional regulator